MYKRQLLQFPFYAGIMGMMVVQNEAGVSLAGVISQFFVNISNNVTFPMLSFLAAGIVNFFVPSGGGQWAVQGPIMMPAGAELGIGAGRTAMAIAWGDQWTNMIQPFWALPALGIAKLSARDIMGYLVVVPVSYTHLDVYKRQVQGAFLHTGAVIMGHGQFLLTCSALSALLRFGENVLSL